MQYSIAEQAAMVLDGEAIRIGDSIVSVATAVCTKHRVFGLPFEPGQHVTLSHGLAAWLHGFGAYPRLLDLIVQDGQRHGIPQDHRVRVRRHRLVFEEDTEFLCGVRVTTPLRTALHLVNDVSCGPEALTSALLLAGGRERLSEALRSAPRVQPLLRQRGLSRLRRGQPVVTL